MTSLFGLSRLTFAAVCAGFCLVATAANATLPAMPDEILCVKSGAFFGTVTSARSDDCRVLERRRTCDDKDRVGVTVRVDEVIEPNPSGYAPGQVFDMEIRLDNGKPWKAQDGKVVAGVLPNFGVINFPPTGKVVTDEEARRVLSGQKYIFALSKRPPEIDGREPYLASIYPPAEWGWVQATWPSSRCADWKRWSAAAEARRADALLADEAAAAAGQAKGGVNEPPPEPAGPCIWSKASASVRAGVNADYQAALKSGRVSLGFSNAKFRAGIRDGVVACVGAAGLSRSDWGPIEMATIAAAFKDFAAEDMGTSAGVTRQQLDQAWSSSSAEAKDCLVRGAAAGKSARKPDCFQPTLAWFADRLKLGRDEAPPQMVVYMAARSMADVAEPLVAYIKPRN